MTTDTTDRTTRASVIVADGRPRASGAPEAVEALLELARRVHEVARAVDDRGAWRVELASVNEERGRRYGEPAVEHWVELLVTGSLPDSRRRDFVWGARRPDLDRLEHGFRAIGVPALGADGRAAQHGAALVERVTGDVVVEPFLAAILMHECIGHSSEADNYEDYGPLLGLGLGDAWTSGERLSVSDDPTVPGYGGSYSFDDDGTPARATPVVFEGRWTALLTSRGRRGPGGELSGNGRRAPGARRSLPRGSVFWAHPGPHTPENLVAGISDGYYCGGARGGGSVRQFVVLQPAWARQIKDGVVTDEIVRDLEVRAHKLQLLRRLEGVAGDTQLFDPYHACHKYGQPRPVTIGAPHLRFRRLHLFPEGR
jgi:predicted Zn-dependent protease